MCVCVCARARVCMHLCMCVLMKLFLYADIVQDHTHYLYDVSLEPHREVRTGQQGIIPSAYQTMFVSNRYSSYLKVYEKIALARTLCH